MYSLQSGDMKRPKLGESYRAPDVPVLLVPPPQRVEDPKAPIMSKPGGFVKRDGQNRSLD